MPFSKTMIRWFTTLLAVAVVFGQEAERTYSADRLLNLSETDLDNLIKRAVEEQMPPRLVDALAVLLMNREETVRPKLATQLTQVISDARRQGEVAMKLEELLAYYPSVAVVDLLVANETQFGRPADRVLPLALSNGIRRENSVALAYRAVERGSDAARRRAVLWIRENAGLPVVTRMLAKSILERHSDAPAALLADPLVQILEADDRLQLERQLALQRDAAKVAK